MSDTTSPLQFDTAEGSPAAMCTVCHQPLGGTYFTLNGALACPSCKNAAAFADGESPGLTGFATAIGLGSAAGVAGAAVWWAIRRFASLEIGLIAIAIGHAVGLGVRRGSAGRGGRGYQVLAVALTYFWITANYVPDVVQAFLTPETEAAADAGGTADDPGAGSAAPVAVSASAAVMPVGAGARPAATVQDAQAPAEAAGEVTGASRIAGLAVVVALVFGVAMAAPFLEGAGNVIGLAIIAFGLYQAWKLNAATSLEIAGPFRLDPPPIPDGRG